MRPSSKQSPLDPNHAMIVSVAYKYVEVPALLEPRVSAMNVLSTTAAILGDSLCKTTLKNEYKEKCHE
jgi:hypothetical protein